MALPDPVLRFAIFLGVFALCAAGEALRPRRERLFRRADRWFGNFGMIALATALVALAAMAVPIIGGVAAVNLSSTLGWGLFRLVDWPGWLEIVLAIVLLDLVIWAQHVATHRIPLLWRLHRVHHTDRELDVTSALRFHPFEILFSAGVRLAAILLLGPAIIAVVLFEIILNASAMFNHSSIALPDRVDRWLRLFVVTPDMHRVHHSTLSGEHNRNFGFFLSIWDRLFGLYKAQPQAGHRGMTIGLTEWLDDRPTRLGWALRLPFARK